MGRVGPNEARPTADLSLTDGTTSVFLKLCDGKGQPNPLAWRSASAPRTALQIASGDQEYSAYEMPFTPITQKNWSGGRGNKDYTDDTSRYYDGYQVNTTLGKIILGPALFHASLPERSTGTIPSASTTRNSISGTDQGYAVLFSLAEVYAVRAISFTIRMRGGASGNVGTWKVKVYTGGSRPDSGSSLLVESGSKRVDYREGATTITLPIQYTMAANTSYWFVVTMTTADGFYFDYYVQTSSGKTSSEYNSATGLWQNISNTIAGLSLDEGCDGSFIPFIYRNSLYAIRQANDFAAPQLFKMNLGGMLAGSSDRGKSSFPIEEDVGYSVPFEIAPALTGGIIKIISGPGSEEEKPYRTIVHAEYNFGTSALDIYVDSPWYVTQTSSSECVLFFPTGFAGYAFDVTGSMGLTKRVTDVLVVDDIIYICQDGYTIRRGRWVSGSWNWAWEGTNETNGTKASMLRMIEDTSGKRKVWRINSVAATVAKSDVKAWGSNLAFGTDIVCGNPKSRITNAVPYGTPQVLWLVKEDGFGSVNNDVYAPVPLNEMAVLASELNGQAICQFNVYLFFSMRQRVERYYDNRLDDLGPDRDEGLPAGRQGNVSCLLPVPGGILAAIDAGAGYSSIQFYNQIGWHELVRAPEAGRRITRMIIQEVPGDSPDLLWFTYGENMLFCTHSDNPQHTPGYQFAETGTLITSWYQGTYRDVKKFLDSVLLFAEGLSAEITVAFSWQSESGDPEVWNNFPDTFDGTADQIPFTSDDTANGRRWRLKITINNSDGDASLTPDITAFTQNVVTRVRPKQAWAFTFLAEDGGRDKQGRPEPLTAAELEEQLQIWADSEYTPNPLTMTANNPTLDGKKVFIDSPTIIPIEETISSSGQKRIKLIGTVNVNAK